MNCLYGYCPPGVCGCAYEDDLTDEERDNAYAYEGVECDPVFEALCDAACEAHEKACEAYEKACGGDA